MGVRKQWIPGIHRNNQRTTITIVGKSPRERETKRGWGGGVHWRGYPFGSSINPYYSLAKELVFSHPSPVNPE